MTTTPNLSIPMLVENQALGEVTHNQALIIIDAFLNGAIESRTTTAQPGSPSDGDVYLLPTSSTGADWAGNDGKIAIYNNGWQYFLTPKAGWRFYVVDEDLDIRFDGTSWDTV